MRFVRGREGALVFDRDQKMNGRAFYLCPDPKCLKSAKKKVPDLPIFTPPSPSLEIKR